MSNLVPSTNQETKETELFENDDQSKEYLKRPSYPHSVIEILREYAGYKDGEKITFLLDAACGSGQFTKPLARYCEKVLAIDISVSQINAANEVKTNAEANIDYRIGNATALEVAANSIDVITVAEALHYFNIPEFYKEVDRCLKPNGVLFIIGYAFCKFELADAQKAQCLNDLFDEFYKGPDILGPCWHERINLLFGGYTTIPIAYSESLKRVNTDMVHEYTLKDLAALLRSFSGYVIYCEKYPEKPNCVDVFMEKFLKVLGNPEAGMETKVTTRWPLYILMSRKPNH